MSTSSTVVAFRANLLAALQAHAVVVADGIQVGDGWQGPETEDEGIYLGDVSFTNELIAFKTADQQPRLEVFEQTVIIQAEQASETPTTHGAAVARVWELFAALEDIVATRDDLAGEMLMQIASGSYVSRPAGPGWAGRLAVLLAVSSDLA